MWVDPDSGKTWEQVIEQVWRDLTHEMRARVHALVVATGKTRGEIFRECRDRFQARLEHYVKRLVQEPTEIDL